MLWISTLKNIYNFGTDLNPDEIGEMARDTNALVVIKDGIVYMAEDMINAIRDAFFDNGAADVKIVLDNIPPSNMNKKITVTTFGGVILKFEDILLPVSIKISLETAKEIIEQFLVIYYNETLVKQG